jgi:hypothetical protein
MHEEILDFMFLTACEELCNRKDSFHCLKVCLDDLMHLANKDQ